MGDRSRVAEARLSLMRAVSMGTRGLQPGFKATAATSSYYYPFDLPAENAYAHYRADPGISAAVYAGAAASSCAAAVSSRDRLAHHHSAVSSEGPCSQEYPARGARQLSKFHVPEWCRSPVSTRAAHSSADQRLFMAPANYGVPELHARHASSFAGSNWSSTQPSCSFPRARFPASASIVAYEQPSMHSLQMYRDHQDCMEAQRSTTILPEGYPWYVSSSKQASAAHVEKSRGTKLKEKTKKASMKTKSAPDTHLEAGVTTLGEPTGRKVHRSRHLRSKQKQSKHARTEDGEDGVGWTTASAGFEVDDSRELLRAGDELRHRPVVTSPVPLASVSPKSNGLELKQTPSCWNVEASQREKNSWKNPELESISSPVQSDDQLKKSERNHPHVRESLGAVIPPDEHRSNAPAELIEVHESEEDGGEMVQIHVNSPETVSVVLQEFNTESAALTGRTLTTPPSSSGRSHRWRPSLHDRPANQSDCQLPAEEASTAIRPRENVSAQEKPKRDPIDLVLTKAPQARESMRHAGSQAEKLPSPALTKRTTIVEGHSVATAATSRNRRDHHQDSSRLPHRNSISSAFTEETFSAGSWAVKCMELSRDNGLLCARVEQLTSQLETKEDELNDMLTKAKELEREKQDLLGQLEKSKDHVAALARQQLTFTGCDKSVFVDLIGDWHRLETQARHDKPRLARLVEGPTANRLTKSDCHMFKLRDERQCMEEVRINRGDEVDERTLSSTTCGRSDEESSDYAGYVQQPRIPHVGYSCISQDVSGDGVAQLKSRLSSWSKRLGSHVQMCDHQTTTAVLGEDCQQQQCDTVLGRGMRTAGVVERLERAGGCDYSESSGVDSEDDRCHEKRVTRFCEEGAISQGSAWDSSGGDSALSCQEFAKSDGTQTQNQLLEGQRRSSRGQNVAPSKRRHALRCDEADGRSIPQSPSTRMQPLRGKAHEQLQETPVRLVHPNYLAWSKQKYDGSTVENSGRTAHQDSAITYALLTTPPEFPGAEVAEPPVATPGSGVRMRGKSPTAALYAPEVRFLEVPTRFNNGSLASMSSIPESEEEHAQTEYETHSQANVTNKVSTDNDNLTPDETAYDNSEEREDGSEPDDNEFQGEGPPFKLMEDTTSKVSGNIFADELSCFQRGLERQQQQQHRDARASKSSEPYNATAVSDLVSLTNQRGPSESAEVSEEDRNRALLDLPLKNDKCKEQQGAIQSAGHSRNHEAAMSQLLVRAAGFVGRQETQNALSTKDAHTPLPRAPKRMLSLCESLDGDLPFSRHITPAWPAAATEKLWSDKQFQNRENAEGQQEALLAPPTCSAVRTPFNADRQSLLHLRNRSSCHSMTQSCGNNRLARSYGHKRTATLSLSSRTSVFGHFPRSFSHQLPLPGEMTIEGKSFARSTFASRSRVSARTSA